MKFKKERQEVVRVAKKLYRKCLVTGSSGNLSLRVDEKNILITPRAKYYEKLRAEDIIILDLDGNIIEGNKEPSSEKRLHIEIYKNRLDVQSIIHTHSTSVCVLAALQLPIPLILDEQEAFLGGKIEVAKYAPTGSMELALEAVKALGNNKAVILSKHGAVVVGSSTREAFDMCELLERLSKIYVFMKLLEKSNHLSK